MKPIVLCILDGVGKKEDSHGNAFLKARTPNFDALWNNYPHSLLEASGKLVGLPEGQMGNSEVGHMNIGAGRIVYQPLEICVVWISWSKKSMNPKKVKQVVIKANYLIPWTFECI